MHVIFRKKSLDFQLNNIFKKFGRHLRITSIEKRLGGLDKLFLIYC